MKLKPTMNPEEVVRLPISVKQTGVFRDRNNICLDLSEKQAVCMAANAYPAALALAAAAKVMRDECQALYAAGSIDALAYVTLGNAIADFEAHS